MKKGTLILLAMVFALSTITQGVAIAAGSTSTSVDVSTTAIAVCTITTGNQLNFGNYAIAGYTERTANGSVGVNCAVGTPYNVFVGLGDNHDATDGRRMMHTSTTEYLKYEIYTANDYANVWGADTSGGSLTYVSKTGVGASVGETLYGKMIAGQSGPLGSYSDTVQVTVAW